MEDDFSTTTWIGRLKSGESRAAQELWEAYYVKLVGFARTKLRSIPRRAVDEEDVALAAFHSFFRGVEEQRFPKIEDRHDLWQLLVMLTARKAIDVRLYETRAKRGGGLVRGESVFAREFDDQASRGIEAVVGDEPTPEFAFEVCERLELLLDMLSQDDLRKIAVMKLEGYSNTEIAQEIDCSLRSIERKLSLIRSLWESEIG